MTWGNADVLGTTWMAGWARSTNSKEGMEGRRRVGVENVIHDVAKHLVTKPLLPIHLCREPM